MYNHRAAIALLDSGGESPSGEEAKLAQSVAQKLATAGFVTLASGQSALLGPMNKGVQAGKGELVLAVGPSDKVPGKVKTIESKTAMGRLETILRVADAIVVLSGGLGSLAVLFEVWGYGSSSSRPFRPLILVGPSWAKGIDALKGAGWIGETEAAMVSLVANAEEAVEALRYYVPAKEDGDGRHPA